MLLIKAASSANSSKSEDVFLRMDCILDMAFVNLLTAWLMDADGSGGVRVDAVVREETLIWRVVSCAWSSFCLDSYVVLSILSWEMVD